MERLKNQIGYNVDAVGEITGASQWNRKKIEHFYGNTFYDMQKKATNLWPKYFVGYARKRNVRNGNCWKKLLKIGWYEIKLSVVI